MTSTEAHRSGPDHQTLGLLVVAVVASLAVGILLLLSSNGILVMAGGVSCLVGLLLLLGPGVAGFTSHRAGRALGAVVVAASLVLLVLAYGSGG